MNLFLSLSLSLSRAINKNLLPSISFSTFILFYFFWHALNNIDNHVMSCYVYNEWQDKTRYDMKASIHQFNWGFHWFFFSSLYIKKKFANEQSTWRILFLVYSTLCVFICHQIYKNSKRICLQNKQKTWIKNQEIKKNKIIYIYTNCRQHKTQSEQFFF